MDIMVATNLDSIPIAIPTPIPTPTPTGVSVRPFVPSRTKPRLEGVVGYLRTYLWSGASLSGIMPNS
jgi:hypothetical protein